MKLRSLILIFTNLLYLIVEALDCTNNPCQLGGYFTEERGYKCFQVNKEAFCTCPNYGIEIDRPCRVCNRTNPEKNPCINSSNLLACLETDKYGVGFTCLCKTSSGPIETASANCDSLMTSTSTMITLLNNTMSILVVTCFNGGYLVDNICHCPSGFGGIFCEQSFDVQLCERITCKNGGVCVKRNFNGPYESKCLCRQGTAGDYCQFKGRLGFCTTNLCLNSATCFETLIKSTRHAYCDCPPGYNGTRCENKYFECTWNGKYIDSFMRDQGKYFQCTRLNGLYRLERKSCPKGLQFNVKKDTCTI